MQLRRLFLSGLLFLTLALTIAPLHAQEVAETTVTDEILAEFEQLIEAEMAYFDIPGAAVAVIEGDEVVYAQGFGVRDLATGEPFTTTTQFRIGSTTKSMTSLLIAQLVDEGVLSWNTPVTEILPNFATADPELTEQITIRDLMGMATGLTSAQLDGLYWGDWDVDALLDAVAGQTIAGEYGEAYAYNNEVYALAGYAAAAAAGLEPTLANYRDLMEENIFDPIGLDSAVITDDPAQLSDNYAESYEISLIDDETRVMTNPPIGVIAPAGAVWMHLEDMARYVITQMNGGVTPDGTRIVSEDALAETWQPDVPVEFEAPGMANTAYGMGWLTQTFQGIPVRFHDGGWAGYNTQMIIYPEDDVAVIVFANATTGGTFGQALIYAFAELLHDLEPQAIAFTHDMTESIDAQVAPLRLILEMDAGDISNFIGEYEQGWRVGQTEDGTLTLSRGEWEFLAGYIPMVDQYLLVSGGATGLPVSFSESEDSVTMTLQLDETNTNVLNLARID